jgi:hypothetical protein
MLLLRFAEWYKQHGVSAQLRTEEEETDNSALKPPELPVERPEIEKGICGVCKSEFKSPTVFLPSGIVYCFTCIYQHLEKQASCPVTKIGCPRPSQFDSYLRRVLP